MDTYEQIESLFAKKYGADTTTRKSVGDFMINERHAVNVKSNNVAKANYSPNMISIKKLHKWVYEDKNDLSFLFVDYSMEKGSVKIISATELIPVEHIDWKCLTVEAQGYGVIQKNKELAVIDTQSKKEFYLGFLKAYEKYRTKETKKHEAFSNRFLDPKTIDW